MGLMGLWSSRHRTVGSFSDRNEVTKLLSPAASIRGDAAQPRMFRNASSRWSGMTRRHSFALRLVVVVVLATAALVSNPVAQPRRRPGVARVLETVNGRRAAAAEVLVKFRRPLAAFERGQLDQQTDADQQDAVGSSGLRRLHSRRFTA